MSIDSHIISLLLKFSFTVQKPWRKSKTWYRENKLTSFQELLLSMILSSRSGLPFQSCQVSRQSNISTQLNQALRRSSSLRMFQHLYAVLISMMSKNSFTLWLNWSLRTCMWQPGSLRLMMSSMEEVMLVLTLTWSSLYNNLRRSNSILI